MDALTALVHVVAIMLSIAVPFSTHAMVASSTSCVASAKPGTEYADVPRAEACEPPPKALCGGC